MAEPTMLGVIFARPVGEGVATGVVENLDGFARGVGDFGVGSGRFIGRWHRYRSQSGAWYCFAAGALSILRASASRQSAPCRNPSAIMRLISAASMPDPINSSESSKK